MSKKKPSYKRSPLSDMEKYTIKGMILDRVPDDKIKESLNRSPTSKVVNDFLDSQRAELETANNATVVQSGDNFVVSTDKPEFDQNLYEATFNELMKKEGMTKDKARELIKNSLEEVTQETDSQKAADVAVQRTTAGDVMIKEAEMGQRGIAAMTQAASERADEAKKAAPTFHHPSVFQPKG